MRNLKQIILVLLFLIYLSTCCGQARLYTYVLTVKDSGVVEHTQDSCFLTKPPNIDEAIVVNFDDNTYYFKVWTYERERDIRIRAKWAQQYTGLATYFDKPYNIGHITYGTGNYIIWIIPLRFTRDHDIIGLRVFIYTNDEKVAKTIKCCNL